MFCLPPVQQQRWDSDGSSGMNGDMVIAFSYGSLSTRQMTHCMLPSVCSHLRCEGRMRLLIFSFLRSVIDHFYCFIKDCCNLVGIRSIDLYHGNLLCVPLFISTQI